MKTKDILQVTVSDFHTGSNYALFVDRFWQGRKGNNHSPTSKQLRIREQFNIFLDDVKQARKGKAVKLVHNGDAIDGDHHNSADICSRNELEQAELHVELMNELQKRIGWRAGDELYYTRGTQTHVHDYENYISEQMNAVYNGDSPVFDLLKLRVNGRVTWYVHKGPNSGKGANEGNAVRNWLRNIYIDALKNGTEIPDNVYTAHFHSPTWSPFGARLKGFQFKTMNGVILPSWQMKTAYAHEVAPVDPNMIGGVMQEIKADGTITTPKFSVMASE